MLNSNIQNKFNIIYETNAWGNGSGWGSSYQHNKQYIEFLQKYLKKHNIKSVFDIGCGDWQLAKNINWSYGDNKRINYIGGDVSSYIIDKNIQKFSDNNTRFTIFDITNNDIPDVDLVIIKDVLQHLSNETVLIAMKKLKKCKRVLIINDTNNLSAFNNFKNINNGDFRCIDINQKPFKLSHHKKYKEIYYYRPSFQYKYIILAILIITLSMFYIPNIWVKIFILLLLLFLIIRYCPYKSVYELVNI
jgi:SAM-dependent methyltransferase